MMTVVGVVSDEVVMGWYPEWMGVRSGNGEVRGSWAWAWYSLIQDASQVGVVGEEPI
jgi:hypothetical protein